MSLGMYASQKTEPYRGLVVNLDGSRVESYWKDGAMQTPVAGNGDVVIQNRFQLRFCSPVYGRAPKCLFLAIWHGCLLGDSSHDLGMTLSVRGSSTLTYLANGLNGLSVLNCDKAQGLYNLSGIARDDTNGFTQIYVANGRDLTSRV